MSSAIPTGSDAPPRSERRTAARVMLDAPVLLDSDRAHHEGRCRDVSTGGVLVTIRDSAKVGDVFDVYFELPRGLAVESRAVVVRVSGHEVALRFTGLDARARIALTAFCRPSSGGLSRLALKFND